jgi:tRNA (guanine26-N2/guanine27-N2)-dimethyltransferase
LKLLNKCLIEADAPATYYDVHSICKSLKLSAPKFDLILSELENNGFEAVKTHYDPLGIKSDAGIEDIKTVLTKLNNN